ncbi:MAG: hypothetical protein ACFFBP_14030 [Promethearchaeota archaeon]
MNVLILNNFFNNYDKIPVYKSKKYFIKYYKNYNLIKLRRLIKKVKKKFDENVRIKIITTGNEKLNIKEDITIELLSEFRINFDREEYLKISREVKNKVKTNLINIINNLKNLKTFHFEGAFLGKLIEVNFIFIFNKILLEFELLKAILQKEDYDHAILFNYNPDFSDFIRYLYTKFENLELYQDSILKKINKRLYLFIFNLFFYILIESIKGFFLKKGRSKKFYRLNEKNNIIFFGYKPKKLAYSPFKTIQPIYEHLRKNKIFYPIHYHKTETSLPLKEVKNLVRKLLHMRKNWFKNQDKIMLNLEYDSIKLNNVLKEFCRLDLFFSLTTSFINLYHFKQFIKDYPPSLIVTTEEFSTWIRLLLNYCKKKNIPTVYIPLSTIVNMEESRLQTDLKYITVSGDKEKEYFIRKGEPANKIIVTGRPRYERFYKEKINKLTEVKDMFDNRIYKFEPNKFTLLLNAAIKDADERIAENVISSVVNSLKRLNILDNLIIKLHPMENGLLQKKILEKLDYRPIIVRDVNIFELLKSCDLYMSRSSTTIIEAMIIGIPIIYLELNNLPYEISIPHLYLENKELLLIAKNQEELKEKIENLINNRDLVIKYSKDLKELSRGYSFYDKEKGPIERIVDLFYKIIN